MGGPLPWQENQLTDAHYHKGSHPIEDAQILDTEDHVVQEERHQATEADAGNPEEGQEHWAGKKHREWSGGTQQNTDTDTVSLALVWSCLIHPHPQGHLHHPI